MFALVKGDIGDGGIFCAGYIQVPERIWLNEM